MIYITLGIILLVSSCQGKKPTITQTNMYTTPTVRLIETMQPSLTPKRSIQPTTTCIVSAMASTTTPLISPTSDNQNVIAFTGTGEDPFNSEIYLVFLNNNKSINLTQNKAGDIMPAWSPDGTRIAFISNRNSDNLQLYIMYADGSEIQQITDGNLRPLHRPSWSPDGSKIVFDAIKPDDTDGIFIVNLINKDIITLINSSFHNMYPSWSPDGTQIAFSSDRDSTTAYQFNIYTLIISTNEVHRLTSVPETDIEPDWSPDGSKIAFSRYINNWPYIYIMDQDGLNVEMINPEKITKDQEGGGTPTWSGDGTKLAYSNTVPIENGPILSWINTVWIDSIFVMNSDGSGSTRLTFGNLVATHPDWRP